MIETTKTPTIEELSRLLPGVWKAGLRATRLLRDNWDTSQGAPVYTRAGRYNTRGWTEWTQGFQFGNALYLHETTAEDDMLSYGRSNTVERMAPHLTHIGVHDHGFNNVSTYGNLLRMMAEGTIAPNEWEAEFYRLSLKVSGAVQAARWTPIANGGGYIHTFNGPHSLFSDTIRSMRVLAVAHQLGHVLMGEQDSRVSLLDRLVAHAEATARFNVYYGTGRDRYDVRGRTVHESIFNVTNGIYRCPSTQQGYSPFSTWTRGLSWVLAGYPEELEWLREFSGTDRRLELGGEVEQTWLRTACAVADYHVATTPPDGIPYWDTGAPGLGPIEEWANTVADPYTVSEPVDSSAAAIAAQGLLRLGGYLSDEAERLAQVELDLDGTGPRTHRAADLRVRGEQYLAAARVTAGTLFQEPYLSTGATHEGILLHAIYHHPNGWDYVHEGETTPYGESCMWGDYHLLELAVMVHREAHGQPPQRFFDIGKGDPSSRDHPQ